MRCKKCESKACLAAHVALALGRQAYGAIFYTKRGPLVLQLHYCTWQPSWRRCHRGRANKTPPVDFAFRGRVVCTRKCAMRTTGY